MGILNATPDSFYSESRVNNLDIALAKAAQMINQGASILDIGGYSSRPGADEVSEKEEIERTADLIAAIKKEHPEILISIDTFRSRVAEEAVKKGADLINDISGGQMDARIFEVAAKHSCPYILMHMRGTPANMMKHTNYDHLINEIVHYFSAQIRKAQLAGVKDIIIDPGFGFSKTLEQNFELLNQLELLGFIGKPILAGVSRKSMIYKTLNTSPEESLNGTTALNMVALEKGAMILRVHDVKAAFETIVLHQKLIS
ncbi:MAG: dihydropteroate synthase [Crocinitomix sp.]|nr:dihydropteroate synthase [Crocinitomix sp.]